MYSELVRRVEDLERAEQEEASRVDEALRAVGALRTNVSRLGVYSKTNESPGHAGLLTPERRRNFNACERPRSTSYQSHLASPTDGALAVVNSRTIATALEDARANGGEDAENDEHTGRSVHLSESEMATLVSALHHSVSSTDRIETVRTATLSRVLTAQQVAILLELMRFKAEEEAIGRHLATRVTDRDHLQAEIQSRLLLHTATDRAKLLRIFESDDGS